MTIGMFLIMFIGFAGGLICALLLTMHIIDEYKDDADFWRNEAIRAGRK